MSAVVRKSITDLTRRKARTFFTILTLALLVMLAPLRRAVRFKPGEAIRYA